MITWIVIRAAGVAAYVLLFGSVAWGLIATTGIFGKKPHRATSTAVHQTLATAALVTLFLHLGGLLIDSYVPFEPLDVLVPMRSGYRPVGVAMGIVAMYLMLVVMASSWTRKRLGPAWWRGLHLLSAPAFALAMVHGVMSGSDAGVAWIQVLYAVSGLIVVFLLIFRGLTTRRVAGGTVTKRSGEPGRTALPDASKAA